MPRFAGVEGGGTTFVVCIGEARDHGPVRIIERGEFPTTSPPETLANVVSWLQAREYDALGVAMFGPIDLNPTSPTWGHITTTPKAEWQHVDFMGPLKKVRNVPCTFDTDVNAPALEEFRQFAQVGETSCAYVTVGTGIGVGLVVNGQCIHGLVHPEGGHIPCLRRRPEDAYKGFTRLHPWSVECQCSSEAIADRAGVSPGQLKDLPDDHEVWSDVAWMLGGLCASICALVSVERIILSGGVMQRLSLFPKIRLATRQILDGYVQHPKILEDGPKGIDGYIMPSVRGNDAGIFGALALAADAYKTARESKAAKTKPASAGGLGLVLAAGLGGAVAVLATLAVVGRRRP